MHVLNTYIRHLRCASPLPENVTNVNSLVLLAALVVGWMAAPKRYAQVPTSRIREGDPIWKKVLANVIKSKTLRWDHPGLSEWALHPTTRVRTGDREEAKAIRPKQRPEWSSHKPRSSGATRRWKRQGMILPRSLQRQHGPASTLISNFWPPQLWENTFLLF